MNLAIYIIVTLLLLFCGKRIITIFSMHNREVGDEMLLGKRETGEYIKGKVVERLEGKVRSKKTGATFSFLCGGKVLDHGKDYYRVEIEED
jgi:hypothetical protein